MTIFAWVLVIAGGAVGTAMVSIGMLEELPDIVRDWFIRVIRPRKRHA